MRKKRIALMLSAAMMFTGVMPNTIIGLAEDGIVEATWGGKAWRKREL